MNGTSTSVFLSPFTYSIGRSSTASCVFRIDSEQAMRAGEPKKRANPHGTRERSFRKRRCFAAVSRETGQGKLEKSEKRSKYGELTPQCVAAILRPLWRARQARRNSAAAAHPPARDQAAATGISR